jgi:hypothetical protein
MSYSVCLTVDTGGSEPAVVAEGWNYTSNCGPMWRAAGADLAEFDGKEAAECLPALEAAIVALHADPETYEAMNPPNGWGSYKSLLPALEALAEDLRRHPRATVTVHR